MDDVARAANVSRPTVSLVLTGRYSTATIAQETRERVLQAARDLGYRRNALAQAVRTGRSFTLGFLMIGEHSEYVTLNLLGALDEAEENGYTVKRFRLHGTPEDERILERCIEQQLDGIIVIYQGMPFPLEMIERAFNTHNVPIVWITPHQTSQTGIKIRPNDEQGIVDAVQYLAELGHQNVAYMGGVRGEGSGIPRLAGFERGVEATRLTTSYVRWTNWEESGSTLALSELMGHEGQPTAIICGSDGMALSVMQKLWRLGFRVPEDVSIIGCGNLARVGFAIPPLTTIAVPYIELGRTAVVQLLALIELQSPHIQTETVLLSAPLVIRESVCPIGNQ